MTDAMTDAMTHDIAADMIDRTVIVRTGTAGVWCGTLAAKSRDEVVLSGARRMWRWKAARSLSLSGVAVHGVNREGSIIPPAVDRVWLLAIEIIPVAGAAAASIMEAPDAEAQ